MLCFRIMMTIVIAVLRSNLEIIIKRKEYIFSVFEALVYIFRDIRILEHIQSHGLLTGNTKNIEIRLVDIYQHSILIIKFGAPRILCILYIPMGQMFITE